MKKTERLLFGILIFVLPLIYSCGDRPSYVLDEDKMVDLLVDMELAEAYVNTQTASSSQDKLEVGNKVLEQHGVSEETLDTTLAWYGRNMDLYSELFDKVDKEILKRREKYVVVPGGLHEESNNLWPYATHLLVSELSGYKSIPFSINSPEIDQGEIVKFSFTLPNLASLKGVMGVEYEDGSGESTFTNFNNRRKIEVELQTDSSKKINRLFGFLDLKEVNVFPFYLDSIAIVTEPLDTMTYRAKQRIQKKFGKLVAQKPPVREELTDSVNNVDSTLNIKPQGVEEDAINSEMKLKKNNNTLMRREPVKPKTHQRVELEKDLTN